MEGKIRKREANITQGKKMVFVLRNGKSAGYARNMILTRKVWREM